MPKHVFSVSSAAADAELQPFADVEKPPAGIYTVVLKKLRLKQNANKEDMLNPLVEIKDVGEKAVGNGYGIWDNLNVTEQGAPFVNNFLDAVGVDRKKFWAEGCITDNEGVPNVTKIGAKRFDAGEIKFRVATKDETYKGQTKLRVIRYLDLKPQGTEPSDEDGEDTWSDDAVAPADDETAETAEEVAEEAAEEVEPVSDEELAEMDLADLKELADSWGVAYTGRATEKTLRKLLHDAQEADPEETPEPEPEPDPEPDADDSDELYDADNLAEKDIPELKRILTEDFEVAVPKPPIRTKLIKAILTAQEAAMSDEPPF